MSVTTVLLQKRIWIAGLFAVLSITAIAQIEPHAAGFMQFMNESMDRMDNGMKAAPMNGNADHDFATMMMPHHQGAIDMAKAELAYEETRRGDHRGSAVGDSGHAVLAEQEASREPNSAEMM
jgi:hypothetical protein